MHQPWDWDRWARMFDIIGRPLPRGLLPLCFASQQQAEAGGLFPLASRFLPRVLLAGREGREGECRNTVEVQGRYYQKGGMRVPVRRLQPAGTFYGPENDSAK